MKLNLICKYRNASEKADKLYRKDIYVCGKDDIQANRKWTKLQGNKKTVLINILDFELFDTQEYISNTINVLENHREYEVMQNPKWYFVELPKFRRTKPDINDTLTQWLLFIDDHDRGMIEMAENKNKTLKEARVVMNYLTGDEEIKRLAEIRENWQIDRNFDMKHAKEEGEKRAKREMIKKMLKNGVDINVIAKCTDMTKEEIEKLKK